MDFKQQYFELWNQAWIFHKKFFNSDGSEKTWKQIVDESGEIAEKYRNTPQYTFMKDLILVVVSEIERVSKGNRNNE